ncbi:MAG: DUF6431 domain-containing protein [Kineosporiaceae bacterium]
MITVLDPDAARSALTAGELACPQEGCGGRLRAWSKARERQVRGRDGTSVRWRPDRAKCPACRCSHVLLPVGYLPRRGYDVHVIGAALLAASEGAGYRRAAAVVGAPASTVRGWLTSVRAGSTTLVAGAIGLIRAAGLDLRPPGRAVAWAGQALPEAVSALGTAARGFVLALAHPEEPLPRPVPAARTGIDYLRIVAERHRRAIHAQLRVIDPTGLLASLRGWPLIGVMTQGRLLTPDPDG